MTHAPIDITGFDPCEMADQPSPMLIWADLCDLVIDRTYQREITSAGRRAIRRMAADFDWKKYQPVLLAPIAGGKYAVVDGQHRAHAAAICGIEALPAMTVPMTIKEQALGFAAVNRDRITIHNCALYRAELSAGAEWAIQCRDIVAAAGCKMATSNASSIMKVPRIIYATNLIRKMVEAGEGAAVTAGLAAIAQSQCADIKDYWTGPVLGVWLSSIAANQRFLTLDLAAAFDDIDVIEIMDAAKIAARQGGGFGKARAIRTVTDHLKTVLADA